MISQGTDGISRGVQIQPLTQYVCDNLLTLLWQPALPSHALFTWTLDLLGDHFPPGMHWLFLTDLDDWS